MKVTDLIKSNGKGTVSVEIEPPALGKGTEKLWTVLDELVELGIHWVDITYHAQNILGHDPQGAPKYGTLKPGTGYVAAAILNRYRAQQISVVPHVICTGFTQRDTEELLVGLSYFGVENVLALRGDPPKGPEGKSLSFVQEPFGHAHSSDLITQIASLRGGNYVSVEQGAPLDFCIGAACYPEGYLNVEGQRQPIEEQLYWMRFNQDQGANYFVSQVFFDNTAFLRFRDKAVAAGIEIPIISGIQPLVSTRYLETMPPIFGCSIPLALELSVREKVSENAGSLEEVRKIGVDWCLAQAKKLQQEGVAGLHFYANRNNAIADVIRGLK